MRFQKEKVKHVRNSSAFNLETGDTEILTHRGQVLGNSNLDDHDWVSSDEEEGKTGGLNKQVVDSLHFGGGLQHKRGGAEADMQMPGKGRLDALQEIVMKSKLHKMQKKEAKEEQEDERTKLDKAYQDLFSGSMLEFNKDKNDRKAPRSDRAGAPSSNEDLDDYDLALKEMTYEAKLPASERTKSAEEIALAEQKRIEELEEARIQRMKQAHWNAKHPGQEVDLDEVEDSKAGKRKHRTDDEIEDSSFAPTAMKVNKRVSRKEAAAEDLEASNAAYNEYIMQDEEYEDSSDEGEEGDDEDEDGDDDDEEEEDEEEDEGSEQEDGESDPEGEDEEVEDELDGSEEENDEDDEEEEVVPAKGKSKSVAFSAGTAAPAVSVPKTKAAKKAPFDPVNIEMPHKIDCPPDLEAFDELVDQYVVDANVDMQALIERILAWNNVNLPGAEGKENRNLMHNFLDILLKHFMRVGDSLARLDVEGQRGTMSQVLIC